MGMTGVARLVSQLITVYLWLIDEKLAKTSFSINNSLFMADWLKNLTKVVYQLIAVCLWLID